jgi:hypothetical protein
MSYPAFEELYDRLRPTLEGFEAERQEVAALTERVQGRLLIASAPVLGVLLLALAQGMPGIGAFIGAIAWLSIAGAIHHMTAGQRQKAYRQRFKSRVIRELVAEMEPGLQYTGAVGIPESIFDNSGLFNHRSDRYDSEDGFRGHIGETEVMFSEVHAQYKSTSRDSKGNTRTTYHTFFDGIFMIADFHKHFRSPVLVLPDVAERSLGLLGKKLQGFRPFSKQKLVYLEDPEFEKHFVVYGADQVEARYILSTSMLRRILDLKTKWDDEVRIHFRDSAAIIAISHRNNLFEPKLKQSALDHHQVLQFCSELAACFAIVADLNLNTRVWTKT